MNTALEFHPEPDDLDSLPADDIDGQHSPDDDGRNLQSWRFADIDEEEARPDDVKPIDEAPPAGDEAPPDELPEELLTKEEFYQTFFKPAFGLPGRMVDPKWLPLEIDEEAEGQGARAASEFCFDGIALMAPSLLQKGSEAYVRAVQAVIFVVGKMAVVRMIQNADAAKKVGPEPSPDAETGPEFRSRRAGRRGDRADDGEFQPGPGYKSPVDWVTE